MIAYKKTKRKPTGAAAMGAGPGRPKGVPNKLTITLREAILLAAEDVGSDGAGQGGLRGYLRRVAAEDVKAFASLLGRVLPLQVAGDSENPIRTSLEVVFK